MRRQRDPNRKPSRLKLACRAVGINVPNQFMWHHARASQGIYELMLPELGYSGPRVEVERREQIGFRFVDPGYYVTWPGREALRFDTLTEAIEALAQAGLAVLS